MTYTEARRQAQKTANETNTSILLYCDPIGQGEQDGADKPWGFCPRDAAELIARFRQKVHDMMIHPQDIQ